MRVEARKSDLIPLNRLKGSIKFSQKAHPKRWLSPVAHDCNGGLSSTVLSVAHSTRVWLTTVTRLPAPGPSLPKRLDFRRIIPHLTWLIRAVRSHPKRETRNFHSVTRSRNDSTYPLIHSRRLPSNRWPSQPAGRPSSFGRRPTDGDCRSSLHITQHWASLDWKSSYVWTHRRAPLGRKSCN